MAKHNIELGDVLTFTKGDRAKTFTASVECDVSKLTTEIVRRLALHGLAQKIADAASQAKTKDEAEATMGKAWDALVAGDWSSRGTGEGVDERTRVARSIMRAMLRDKFGLKSPEWAKFTGKSDADQAATLDANVAKYADKIDALVDERIAERKAAEARKREVAASVTFDI